MSAASEIMLPWVGLYTAVASFICIVAMAADAVQAIWQWKLWFPNRFFTLNAATITLIAIAMKLPVDLSTGIDLSKLISLFFLVTMLANFLPSLGLMDDRELLMNIVALAILVITIAVNMGIQSYIFSYSGVCLHGFISEKAYNGPETSDYKWSLNVIYTVQLIGVVVGSIAPILRCFTSIGHYSLSKKLSKNHLNVFRVEKHWIQTLQQWKRYHVHSHIPGRRFKIVFHCVKNTLLNFCIALHIVVLVICKIIRLVPQTILILLSCCWYLFKSFLKWLKKVANTSSTDTSSEIEEYARYVVQIDEEAKLSNRILRNTLHSITQLLNAQKEPRNLMMLLEKSRGFKGVIKFDSDQVIPLYPDQTHNCWSLVVVTLTTIAIALPNIADVRFKGLLAGIREGLHIVRHIEDCLNADGELVDAIRSARRVWKEVEVHQKWLHVDLQKMARKGKSSKEILNWLGDEAEKVMKRFKSSKKSTIDHSPYKFILASSMYRTSKTILMHFSEQEIWLNYEELYEQISTIIADVLFACFTNLPCVIKLKCHHNAIEKRGDNIRIAAQLLGKSKRILKILKARPLPNIQQNSMAYVDKWRVLTNIQIRDDGVASNGIQPSSSSCKESIVSILQ